MNEYPYIRPEDIVDMAMLNAKCTEDGKHVLVSEAERLAEIWNSCILGLNTVVGYMVDEGMPKDFQPPTIHPVMMVDDEELCETNNNIAYEAGYAYASGYHD